MARPRGGEWLEAETRPVRGRCQLVVSLLEPREDSELGLRDEPTYADTVVRSRSMTLQRRARSVRDRACTDGQSR